MLAVNSLALVALVSLAEGAWNPTNELNKVEAALKKIVDSPFVTGAQLTAAKHVVSDVEHAVATVQASNGLSKQKRQEVLAVAIKELQGLQAQWSLAASGNRSAMSEKLHILQKELVEKRALLNQTQGLLKFAKLKKELSEKKLQLQGLMDAKAKAEALEAESQRAREQAAAAQLVAKARALAANASQAPMSATAPGRVNTSGALPGPLKAIASKLQQQAHNLTEEIAKADAAERNRKEEADHIIKAQVPAKDSKDATRRGQLLLKSISAKARRQYRKWRAAREAQLAELNEGIRSIQAGDVAALQRLMAKMQDETKALESKSRGFLH